MGPPPSLLLTVPISAEPAAIVFNPGLVQAFFAASFTAYFPSRSGVFRAFLNRLATHGHLELQLHAS